MSRGSVNGTGKSGWCIDGLHGDRCKWSGCSCGCHATLPPR